jgi:lysophospholipase L1-like esterase
MRIVFFGDSLTSGVPGCSFLPLLRAYLPDDTLVNQGRGNDTVISLYGRVKQLRFDEAIDIAFLWIGVNDVAASPSRVYRLLNAAAGQRRAPDLDEFRSYYRATLDLISRHAGRVVAVSPLIRGEDLGNKWNQQLEELSGVIEELVSGGSKVEYLDLRSAFQRRLAGEPISVYMPKGHIYTVLDALTLRSDEQVDAVAARRGLHLTLDGLHLNRAGAKIVANEFREAIEGYG